MKYIIKNKTMEIYITTRGCDSNRLRALKFKTRKSAELHIFSFPFGSWEVVEYLQ